MMSEDSSNSQAPRELQVPQDRETGVQEIAAGHFRLRYLYARSSDCRQSGDPGQDYVALRQDGRRLAFALCDGVSQSFYGDLAARFLGDALVEWLWRHLPPGEFRRESIRQPLREHLLALTGEATEKVRQAPIPEDAPPLLRDVLEQKRAIGSEATFVCGVVEMPGPNLPQGRVVLAWLGDAELQLWGQEHDRTQELGAEWIEARRWSTRVGPKGGPIGVFVGPLEDVQRVLAYSDGIAALRGRLGRGLGDSELAREVERLGQTPTSDDVSFLEIKVLPEPVAAAIPVTVPAPVVPPRPPVEPPPPSPRARPWPVYAGAGVAFVALCLVVLVSVPLIMKRRVNLFESPQRTPTLNSSLPTPTLISSPMLTATPTTSPTLTSSPTATETPLASPTLVATTTPVTEPTATISPMPTETPLASPTVTPGPTATPESSPTPSLPIVPTQAPTTEAMYQIPAFHTLLPLRMGKRFL